VTVPRIAAIRSEKGIDQKTLADKVGIPRMSLHRIETGVSGITATMRDLIAGALGVEPGDLDDPVDAATISAWGVSRHLYSSVLACFDELQNANHLVAAARLALDSAEIDHDDRAAVAQLLIGVQKTLGAMMSAMTAANERDAAALRSTGGAQ